MYSLHTTGIEGAGVRGGFDGAVICKDQGHEVGVGLKRGRLTATIVIQAGEEWGTGG